MNSRRRRSSVLRQNREDAGAINKVFEHVASLAPTTSATTPDNIGELKEHARVLQGLLSDPQPGLISWRLALNATIKAIGEFHA